MSSNQKDMIICPGCGKTLQRKTINSTAHKATDAKRNAKVKPSNEETIINEEQKKTLKKIANDAYTAKQRTLFTDDEIKNKWALQRQVSRDLIKAKDLKVKEAIQKDNEKVSKSNMEIGFKLIKQLQELSDAKIEDRPIIQKQMENTVNQARIDITKTKTCKAITKEQMDLYPNKKLRTFKNNNDRINTIYKNIFHKDFDCSSFEWLRNTEKITKAIMEFKQKNGSDYTAGSRADFFSSLASKMKDFKGFEREHLFYSNKATTLKKGVSDNSKENKLSEKEKLDIVKWSTIKNLKKDVMNKRLTTWEDRMIYLLYTEIPVRRLQDYARLILIRLKKGDTFNPVPTQNYLIFNQKQDTCQLYIDTYKGKARNTHGIFKETISGDLFKTFQTFTSNTKPGHFVFFPSKTMDNLVIKDEYSDKSYTQMLDDELNKLDSKLGTIVKATFRRIRGDGNTTLNSLRHSYASSWLNNKSFSSKKKHELAYKMGTSLKTLQDEYLKLELQESDGDDDYDE